MAQTTARMAMPRQPMSFRERVLFQFRSPTNEKYLERAFRSQLPAGDRRLQFILRTLPGAVQEYGSTHGPGGAILDSDPLAMRGSASRSSNLVEELQHLNRAFFHQRIREASHNLGPGDGPKGMNPSDTADSEPLFYQMFVADSLRPPGLENLNGGGPLWELHEDQRPATAFSLASGSYDEDRKTHQVRFDPSIGVMDMPWSVGKGERTAEAVVAEYYAEQGFADPDGFVVTPVTSAMAQDVPHESILSSYDPITDRFAARPPMKTLRAASTPMGPTNLEIAQAVREGRTHLQGMKLPHAAGTMGGAGRFQRRGIPRWQRGGRREEVVAGRWMSHESGPRPGMPAGPPPDPWSIYDEAGGTFDETLGSGSSEFGGERLGHIRRFDMSRLRHPQGEETTLLGGRTW